MGEIIIYDNFAKCASSIWFTLRVHDITNKIIPTIEELQNRPLERVYPIVFLGAMHYNVRENGQIIKKAVYIKYLLNKYIQNEKKLNCASNGNL